MRYLRSIIKMAVVILATVSIASAALITSDNKDNIVISGEIEYGDSAQLLVALSETEGKGPLHLTINSHGGSAGELWTMLNLIDRKLGNRPLHTYGYGNLYSAGAVLFLAGDVRTLSSTATVMLHFGRFQDTNTGNVIERNSERGRQVPDVLWDRLENNNEMFWNMVKAKTTLPRSYLEESRFLSAKEALKYGVCTQIKNLEGGRYNVKKVDNGKSNRRSNDRGSSVER